MDEKYNRRTRTAFLLMLLGMAPITASIFFIMPYPRFAVSLALAGFLVCTKGHYAYAAVSQERSPYLHNPRWARVATHLVVVVMILFSIAMIIRS